MKSRTYLVPMLAVFIGVTALAQPAVSKVIFEESFDDLPDWTSTMYSTEQRQTAEEGHVLPEGWYGIYQGTRWSPETGYPDKHASLEILAENADKAYGGTGKSAVFWRESHSLGWKNWASDAHFIKLLDEQQQLYVEFQIRFSENWWQRDLENYGNWTSKIFRIGHWTGEGSIWNSQTGDVNPRMFWDYKKDNYGVRNILAFRHGPPGENEKMPQERSYNYTKDLLGQGPDGTTPKLTDRLNSTTLLANGPGPVTHEQIFGRSNEWTKVAFFVKMNSSPGKNDGVFRQWINGVQIVNMENMEWIKDYPGAQMVGWNYFAIGGNDYFQARPNEDRFEDWYAIDNVVVSTEILAGEASGDTGSNPPLPPTRIEIRRN